MHQQLPCFYIFISRNMHFLWYVHDLCHAAMIFSIDVHTKPPPSHTHTHTHTYTQSCSFGSVAVRSPSIDTSGSGNQCNPNPKILQGINDTTAPRGASVTFSCVASISAQSSKSKFIWTTTAKGIASLEGSDNRTACRISSTLVLNNVSTNNSGQYNCTAVTEDGNYTSNGYLQITGNTGKDICYTYL